MPVRKSARTSRSWRVSRVFPWRLPSQASSWAPSFWPSGSATDMVPTSYYLILSAVLFGLGVLAFVFKRNIITIFMAIELMLNAVNLAFVAFSQALHKSDGEVFVLFVIVVAAAEA